MSERVDLTQPIISASGEKPAFVRVVFPAPRVEIAGGGPLGGASTEEYVRLSLLPQELRDRVVLVIRESLRLA